jgi:hypothetical protein
MSSPAAITSERPPRADGFPPSLPLVRNVVRNLLLSSAAYQELDTETRREVAQKLVTVCDTAVRLIQKERELDREVAELSRSSAGTQAQVLSASPPPFVRPLAFSNPAAQVAATTRDILNAVSFPRFVTDLINGVFRAMVDSNRQQMHSYVELIRNVAATTEGFADANLGLAAARDWLLNKYPEAFELDSGDLDEDSTPEERAEAMKESRLRRKPNAQMPTPAGLRLELGLKDAESVPDGDPETTMVPFVMRALARQRQQMLATMVMLGMQRIVVESGRLNASMRFHIDTRSIQAEDSASKAYGEFSFGSKGSVSYAGWGAEASMSSTIGYVSTQRRQSTDEMNTDLDLNSSVELYFKTDYVPLERMAGGGQVDRIKANTINPDAEMKSWRDEREKRMTAQRGEETARRGQVQNDLTVPKDAHREAVRDPTIGAREGEKPAASKKEESPPPPPKDEKAGTKDSRAKTGEKK